MKLHIILVAFAVLTGWAACEEPLVQDEGLGPYDVEFSASIPADTLWTDAEVRMQNNGPDTVIIEFRPCPFQLHIFEEEGGERVWAHEEPCRLNRVVRTMAPGEVSIDTAFGPRFYKVQELQGREYFMFVRFNMLEPDTIIDVELGQVYID